MADLGDCFGCGDEFVMPEQIVSEDNQKNLYCKPCTEELWQEFERKRKLKQDAKRKLNPSKPATIWR
jgi:hypothetical protein